MTQYALLKPKWVTTPIVGISCDHALADITWLNAMTVGSYRAKTQGPSTSQGQVFVDDVTIWLTPGARLLTAWDHSLNLSRIINDQQFVMM